MTETLRLNDAMFNIRKKEQAPFRQKRLGTSGLVLHGSGYIRLKFDKKVEKNLDYSKPGLKKITYASVKLRKNSLQLYQFHILCRRKYT